MKPGLRLTLLLAAVIVLLTPLAYATPPDPSWIRGLYDGGDFDDVVVLITGGSGVVEQSPPCHVVPLPAADGVLLQGEDGQLPVCASSSHQTRAPPTP